MKKIIVLFLVMCMLFALVACGDSNSTGPSGSASSEPATTSEEPVDAEIVESGYAVDNGFLYYAVTLHNPNTDYAISLPSYRITAKDEGGAVLGTFEHTLSVIYPGQDFSYASQGFECSEEPATVDFEILPSDSYNFQKASSLEHPEYQSLEVVGASINNDGFMSRVLGEVKNNNDYDIDSAVVSVFFRDADGNLTGGMNTFVDHIPAGGTAAFDLGLYADIATETFEVYADNWL